MIARMGQHNPGQVSEARPCPILFDQDVPQNPDAPDFSV